MKVLQLFLSAVAWASLFASTTTAAPEDWDQVNEFLSGVSFLMNGQSDFVRVGDLPQEIKDIVLLDIWILKLKLGETFTDDTEFALQDTECGGFGLNQQNSTIRLETAKTGTPYHIDFIAEEVALECPKGIAKFRNLEFQSGFIQGLIGAIVGREGDLPFEIRNSGRGFTLDLLVHVDRETTTEFPQLLPGELTIDECAVVLASSSIQADLASVLGLSGSILEGAVNAAGALIVTGVVGLLACGVIEQFAQLETEPGYISRVSSELSDFLRDLASTPERDLEALDVLAGEEITDVWGLEPEEVTVYNSDNTILNIAQTFVNGILGSKNNDTNDLTINAFANQLTENTGEFRLEYGSAYEYDSSYTESVNVENAYMAVDGVNTFEILNLLALPAFTSKYTLYHTANLERLGLGAGGDFTIIKSNIPPSELQENTFYIFATKPLVLDLNMKTIIEDPELQIHTVTGLTPDELDNVGVGELISDEALEGQTSIACASQAFAFFNMSDIKLPNVQISELAISGVVDKGLDDLLRSGTEIFAALYLNFFQENFDGIIRGYIDAFNAYARDFIEDSKNDLEACPAFEQPNLENYTPQYIEFNSDMVQTVRGMMADTIEKVNEPGVGINSVLRQLVGNSQHELVLGDLFSFALPPVDGKTAELGIKKLKFINPDSFAKIALFKPVGVPEGAYDPQAPEYYTENAFNLGYTHQGVDGGPLIVELTVELNTGGIAGLPEEKESFPLRLSLSEMNILVTVMAKADLTNLYPYTVGTLLEYPYCLVNSVVTRIAEDSPGFRIESLKVEIGQIDFVVDCGNCPLQKQLETDEAKAAVTSEFNLLIALFSNEVKSPVATEELNKLFRSFGTSCEEGYGYSLPERPSLPSDALTIALVINGGLFGAIGAGVVFLAMTSQRRIKKSSASALNHANLLGKVNSGKFSDPADLVAMFNFRKSLFFDSRNPTWLKLVTLLMAMIALSLFAVSNVVLNNSVSTTIVLQDSVEAQLPSIYDLTLLKEVNGLFFAGAPEVGIGSVLSSMVFSFVTVVLAVYAMVAPPSHLSVSRRQRLLNVLVIGTKFILSEKIIVLVMTNLFDLEVKMPVAEGRDSLEAIFPEGFLHVIIKFLPASGYFFFYVGVILDWSILLIVTSMHRSIQNQDWEQSKDVMEDSAPKDILPKAYSPTQREKLFSHIFTVPGTSKGRAKVAAFGKLILVLAPIFGAGIVYGTMFIDTFYFEILGVAGGALRLTEEGSTYITFSISKLALGLSSVAAGLDDPGTAFGILFLQVFVFITLVIAPLIMTVTSLVMVFAALTPSQRQLCQAVSTAVWTVCILEAVIILVGFTTIYIQSLSSLATFSICYEVDVYLSTYITGFGLPPEQATCAGVRGGVFFVYWIALLGSGLMYWSNSFICKLNRLVLQDVDGRAAFDTRDNNMKKGRKRMKFLARIGVLKLAGADDVIDEDRLAPSTPRQNSDNFDYNGSDTFGEEATSQYDLSMLREGLVDRTSANPRFRLDDDGGSLASFASAGGMQVPEI